MPYKVTEPVMVYSKVESLYTQDIESIFPWGQITFKTLIQHV